jgi:hypothetical protein
MFIYFGKLMFRPQVKQHKTCIYTYIGTHVILTPRTLETLTQINQQRSKNTSERGICANT